MVELAPGVWVTSGRAVVVEGEDALCLIDPGDEPMLDADNEPLAGGPLANLLALIEQTGKPLRTVLLTHAHPDHTANLYTLQDFARRSGALDKFKLVAHAKSPLTPDMAIPAPTELGAGLIALPTPGHTHWGDDLSFWHPESAILFSGDLVQPKGERWESTFYPSPYPYFTDGDLYIKSLDALLALPFETLVTGHREVRFAPAGRRWVEVTRQAISRVEDEVMKQDGINGTGGGTRGLEEAGPEIYRTLARARGIDEATIGKRLAAGGDEVMGNIGGNTGGSTFSSFDLPGIRYYWERRFGAGELART